MNIGSALAAALSPQVAFYVTLPGTELGIVGGGAV
jgi:hypothetical protein